VEFTYKNVQSVELQTPDKEYFKPTYNNCTAEQFPRLFFILFIRFS